MTVRFSYFKVATVTVHLRGRLLTTDPEQLLRNCSRLYFEASDLEAFCNAKW